MWLSKPRISDCLSAENELKSGKKIFIAISVKKPLVSEELSASSQEKRNIRTITAMLKIAEIIRETEICRVSFIKNILSVLILSEKCGIIKARR